MTVPWFRPLLRGPDPVLDAPRARFGRFRASPNGGILSSVGQMPRRPNRGWVMLKRIGVVMAAAMLGVVALTGPASSQPEPRFTLTINPTQGPVGTNIHAQLPAEATTPGGECLSKNEIQAGLQQLIAGLISGGDITDPAQKALLGVINGGIASIDPNDPNAFKFFF